MFWSDLGSAVGFEAIGLVDASLPTVAVFAKRDNSDKETEHLALNESEASGDGAETKEKSPRVTNSTIKEKDCEPMPEAYDKGVIFYMQDDRIVGILLWNVFNRISIARKILSSDETFNDLNEVAKLFDIFDQHHDEKK
jgi:programmed cell death 8 (apoptosis-inducing factor)